MDQNVDVKKYRQRAYRKKKVLSAFLKKLEKKRPAEARPAMKEAEKKAWAEVNCQKCGNCCKTMTPTWKKSEVKKVAAHFGMTYKEFFDKFKQWVN
jgi:hypothetical protein